MNKNNYAVIMAGGVGSRFWPMSTQEFPKQFHDMLGTGQSLIQRTFERINELVPSENILIATNERYEKLVLEQVPKCNKNREKKSKCFWKQSFIYILDGIVHIFFIC